MKRSLLFFVPLYLFCFLISAQNPETQTNNKLLSYNKPSKSNSQFHTYPNQFYSNINIAFYIPYKTRVKLTVFDLNGRLIARIRNSEAEKGKYNLQWNGTNDTGAPVENGVYLMHLEAGDIKNTSRVMLKR